MGKELILGLKTHIGFLIIHASLTNREDEMRRANIFLTLIVGVLIITSVMGCGGTQAPVAEIERSDYIGCYRDKGDAGGVWGRDLDKFFYNSNTMTIPKCIEDCRVLEYKYAWLQSQNQCFCGDSYGKVGEAPGECTKRCIGDASMICGGTWANSIYETGYVGE